MPPGMCDYQPFGAMMRCAACGDMKDRRYTRQCPALAIKEFVAPQVGDILMDLVHARYRVPPCKLCHETARRMNVLGIEGCRREAENLAEELQSNANSRAWTWMLAKAAGLNLKFYEDLILEACDIAESRSTTLTQAVN